MSERSHHRRPATFKLDDPGVIVMDPDDASRPPRGTVHVTPEVDPALLPVPVEAPILRRFRGLARGRPVGRQEPGLGGSRVGRCAQGEQERDQDGGDSGYAKHAASSERIRLAGSGSGHTGQVGV